MGLGRGDGQAALGGRAQEPSSPASSQGALGPGGCVPLAGPRCHHPHCCGRSSWEALSSVLLSGFSGTGVVAALSDVRACILQRVASGCVPGQGRERAPGADALPALGALSKY